MSGISVEGSQEVLTLLGQSTPKHPLTLVGVRLDADHGYVLRTVEAIALHTHPLVRPASQRDGWQRGCQAPWPRSEASFSSFIVCFPQSPPPGTKPGLSFVVGYYFN